MSQTVVNALWDPTDDGKSAAGFEAVINPRQMAHIDTSERQSFLLQCDGNAERLVIVDPSTCVKFIMTTQSLIRRAGLAGP